MTLGLETGTRYSRWGGRRGVAHQPAAATMHTSVHVLILEPCSIQACIWLALCRIAAYTCTPRQSRGHPPPTTFSCSLVRQPCTPWGLPVPRSLSRPLVSAETLSPHAGDFCPRHISLALKVPKGVDRCGPNISHLSPCGRSSVISGSTTVVNCHPGHVSEPRPAIAGITKVQCGE